MTAEVVQAVDIFESCDFCLKEFHPSQLRGVDKLRPVLGSEDMAQVMLCVDCYLKADVILGVIDDL